MPIKTSEFYMQKNRIINSRYSQKDIVDFLEKNKHKSFDVKL